MAPFSAKYEIRSAGGVERLGVRAFPGVSGVGELARLGGRFDWSAKPGLLAVMPSRQ